MSQAQNQNCIQLPECKPVSNNGGFPPLKQSYFSVINILKTKKPVYQTFTATQHDSKLPTLLYHALFKRPDKKKQGKEINKNNKTPSLEAYSYYCKIMIFQVASLC